VVGAPRTRKFQRAWGANTTTTKQLLIHQEYVQRPQDDAELSASQETYSHYAASLFCLQSGSTLYPIYSTFARFCQEGQKWVGKEWGRAR
jgi:hypothetical protein